MAINKTYQYKIFSPLGAYLGLLPFVRSDFNYNQTINSAGAQIQISVGQSADTADQPVGPILDELGNAITDETGQNLLIERVLEPVGSANSNNLIQNNNLIQVWEFSSYAPNGVIKFNGYISKWKVMFGTTDDILITCINLAQDLNQIVIQTGDSPSMSQLTDNGTLLTLNPGNGKGGLDLRAQFQNFTAASTFSLGGVAVELTTTQAGTLTISVYTGNLTNGQILSAGSPIATASTAVGVIAKTPVKVTFNSFPTLTSGQPYYFLVGYQPNDFSTTTASLWANSTNPYAAGDSGFEGTTGTYSYVQGMNNADMYFILYAHGASTNAPYVNKDPSFILTDIINSYINKGGAAKIPQLNITKYVQALFNDLVLSSGYWGDSVDQIFTPSSNRTINIIQLFLGVTSGSKNLNVSIYVGDPSINTADVTAGRYTYNHNGANHFYANSNITTFSNTTGGVTTFTFTNPVNLIAGQSYYLHMEWGQGDYGFLQMFGASSGEVPSDTQVGRLWQSIASFNNTGANPVLSSAHPYLYFVLGYYPPPVPTSLSSGYINTGVNSNYSFKLNTTLSGIQTVYALGPSNWYWYVDIATNTLYYQAASPTADITIVRRKHINTLDIEATKENIVNDVYFSGGDDGTGTNTNILVERTDSSTPTNRKGLAIISDNRVTSTTGGVTTARALADAYIAKNNSETYITNITLQDTTMNISNITLGMMIGFSGFGNFVDKLLLQVVGINYSPDQVTLQLGTIPKSQTTYVQNLLNQVTALQTGNNPATPS